MSIKVNYEDLIKKYCLEQTDVLSITNAVLRDASLIEAQSEINGRLSQEKVYVIAKAICKDLVGEDINRVAPRMVADREVLAKQQIKSKNKSKLSKSKDDEDNSTSSAEDFMQMLSEAFYEVDR